MVTGCWQCGQLRVAVGSSGSRTAAGWREAGRGAGGGVGSVSASRYAQIVAELRKLVETATGIQFAIGDAALGSRW